MKLVRLRTLGGSTKLTLVEDEQPKPRPGELLVKIRGFMAEVALPMLFTNQIRISGISIGSRTDQEDMIRAITANQMKPVIDRSFQLEDIVAGFRYYESHQHFGKVCLDI